MKNPPERIVRRARKNVLLHGSARIVARCLWYSSGVIWSALYFASNACSRCSFVIEIGRAGATIGTGPELFTTAGWGVGAGATGAATAGGAVIAAAGFVSG